MNIHGQKRAGYECGGLRFSETISCKPPFLGVTFVTWRPGGAGPEETRRWTMESGRRGIRGLKRRLENQEGFLIGCPAKQYCRTPKEELEPGGRPGCDPKRARACEDQALYPLPARSSEGVHLNLDTPRTAPVLEDRSAPYAGLQDPLDFRALPPRLEAGGVVLAS